MSNSIGKLMGPLTRDRTTRRGQRFPEPFPLAETANVLCKRHNEIFGASFDQVGLKVATAIERVFRNEAEGEHILINGLDFERFLFQRLAAYHFGKIFTAEREPLNTTLSDEMIEKVMLKMDLPAQAGLYLADPPPHHDTTKTGYEITPLITITAGKPGAELSGIRVSFRNIAFVLVLDRVDYSDLTIRMHRPRGVLYIDEKTQWRKALIQFCWPHGTSQNTKIEVHSVAPDDQSRPSKYRKTRISG